MFEVKTEDRYRRHIIDRLQAAALVWSAVNCTATSLLLFMAVRLNTLLFRPLLVTIIKSMLPTAVALSVLPTTLAVSQY